MDDHKKEMTDYWFPEPTTEDKLEFWIHAILLTVLGANVGWYGMKGFLYLFNL